MSQLALVCQRDSSSGLPVYLERAFRARGYRVDVVDAMSLPLPRLELLLRSFHPSRKRWSRRREILEFYTIEAWWRNTDLNGRLLDRVWRAGGRVLQVGGLYFPHPDFQQLQCHLFLTYTMRLAFRDGISPWVPEPHERAGVVALETELYRHARHIFVSAEFVRRHLIEDYGVRPQNVTTVGMGVDDFYRAHMPDAPSQRVTKNLLFVGYTFDLKGGPDLLQAFALAREQIPDLRLFVLGPAGWHGLRVPGVQFVGEVKDKWTLLDYYRNADLLCLPSRCDSFGFVFLEAMSQGIVCIGSDLNAMPEIISHGETGFVVRPGDVEGLARCILDFYRAPERKWEMGRRAQARVCDRYVWGKVVQRMDEIMFGEQASAVTGSRS